MTSYKNYSSNRVPVDDYVMQVGIVEIILCFLWYLKNSTVLESINYFVFLVVSEKFNSFGK